MNYNKLLLGILIAVSAAFASHYIINQESATKTPNSELDIQTGKEIPVEESLFRIFVDEKDLQVDYETKTVTYSGARFELKPELMELYHKIGVLDQSQNTIVIYPIFTEAAYSKNGFYDYYREECDSSCLTVPIPTDFDGEYSSSRAAFNSLQLLGYEYISDVEVDKDPEILKKYDKVILLHNEYVTKKEFDAITQHPKVIYLYPNSLYAEVVPNYTDNTITLIRGHEYPSSEIRNGFGWKFDNSHLEYDNKCENWEFYDIDNGMMLNCYPEYVIFRDSTLLSHIKDY